MKHKEFNSRSDEEIFELIFKSNQLEEEFKPQYKYLPILENTIWQDCHISIDETTDAWQIAMIQEDKILKIMWKGWRKPCPKSKLNKHYSIVVERDFVINSINECLLYLDEKLVATTSNNT
ncbi:MAG: hypothetical protein IT271_07965 [Chitinophagales bacterium]|nr:hypothetical protein [Chitinophagales bacterium]